MVVLGIGMVQLSCFCLSRLKRDIIHAMFDYKKFGIVFGMSARGFMTQAELLTTNKITNLIEEEYDKFERLTTPCCNWGSCDIILSCAVDTKSSDISVSLTNLCPC